MRLNGLQKLQAKRARYTGAAVHGNNLVEKLAISSRGSKFQSICRGIIHEYDTNAIQLCQSEPVVKTGSGLSS